jgi:hypothetical protein
MKPTEEATASDYIKALSELLSACLHDMLHEGRSAGAFDGIEDEELQCYIAALCVRGGLVTLNKERPEGDVLEICHAIMKTAIIALDDDDEETVH